MATDDVTVADGVRWLAEKRVTLGVVSLLLAVFVFELVVLAAYGIAGWQYIFLAHLEPQPAWVFAPFAHRNISHLLTTLVVIVVYGALVEDWLPASTFLAFYVLAGYVSTLAQLSAYATGAPGLGTLGASGAGLGLVALHTVRTAGRAVWEPQTVDAVDGVFVGTGLVIVASVLLNDFVAGVTFVAGTAPLGHVGGILAGTCYGLVRVRAQQQRTPSTTGEI